MEYVSTPMELDYALNSPVAHSPTAAKETAPLAWRAACAARATPAQLIWAQALYFSGIYILLLINASLLVAICAVAAKMAQEAREARADAQAIMPEIKCILALVRDFSPS